MVWHFTACYDAEVASWATDIADSLAPQETAPTRAPEQR